MSEGKSGDTRESSASRGVPSGSAMPGVGVPDIAVAATPCSDDAGSGAASEATAELNGGRDGPRSAIPAPVIADRLRPRHLCGVLCFHAGSIRAAAATRWSLAVGLLLVVSGGIARHYDKADLIAGWPLLLRGVVISAINATLLFMLCCTIMPRRRPWPVDRAFLGFLGVFWLTAPMAWLYGIPYERWMPAEQAASWNYLTLGVVSVWRVGLMARVVSVLFGIKGIASLVMVLVLADTVAVVALFESGMAIVSSMGGVGMSSAEMAESAVAETALTLACMTWPVWAIGMIVVWVKQRGVWTLRRGESRAAPIGPLAVAVMGVIVWVGLAWPGHAVLRRERLVEERLRTGSTAGVHAVLMGLDRGEMPPGWSIDPDDLDGTKLLHLVAMHELAPLPAPSVELLIPLVEAEARSSLLPYSRLREVPWRTMPRALDAEVINVTDRLERARPWLEFMVRNREGLAADDRAGMIEIIRRADPAAARRLETESPAPEADDVPLGTDQPAP